MKEKNIKEKEMITPITLSMPSWAVCLTSGIIKMAKGTNIPLTTYRYAKLYHLLRALFLPIV